MAHKWLEDTYYRNSHWAKVGGISVKELNRIEMKVLELLDWTIFVSTEEYEMKVEEMRQMEETDVSRYSIDDEQKKRKFTVCSATFLEKS